MTTTRTSAARRRLRPTLTALQAKQIHDELVAVRKLQQRAGIYDGLLDRSIAALGRVVRPLKASR